MPVASCSLRGSSWILESSSNSAWLIEGGEVSEIGLILLYIGLQRRKLRLILKKRPDSKVKDHRIFACFAVDGQAPFEAHGAEGGDPADAGAVVGAEFFEIDVFVFGIGVAGVEEDDGAQAGGLINWRFVFEV